MIVLNTERQLYLSYTRYKQNKDINSGTKEQKLGNFAIKGWEKHWKFLPLPSPTYINFSKLIELKESVIFP